MAFVIAGLARYPVKALSADESDSAELRPHEPMAGDRRFALALAGTRTDFAEGCWLPPERLVTLPRYPRLALLETRFDAVTGMLEVCRRGRRVVAADITGPTGRAVMSEFFSAFLAGDLFGHPRIIERGGFGERPRALLSLVGAGSLAEIERVAGRPLGLTRLRTNVLVGGVPPWQELGWVGCQLAVGPARLKVVDVIVRREPLADPGTGSVDTVVPLALQAAFHHRCLGVFAEVVAGGMLAVGDEVRPLP
jgi:uncharacterized protein